MPLLLAALVSQSVVTQAAVFGAVAVVAWWVLDSL